jgi:hypothetical protein
LARNGIDQSIDLNRELWDLAAATAKDKIPA